MVMVNHGTMKMLTIFMFLLKAKAFFRAKKFSKLNEKYFYVGRRMRFACRDDEI
jgi:hypothetical protein